TQFLYAGSTYTGSTTINGGGLYTAVSNALPTNTDVTIATGGALNLGGNQQTVGSLAGNGTVVLSSGALTVSGPSSTSYAGTIVDLNNGGQVIKSGTGTLTLTGVNTYTGTTTINGGAISVASNSNFGAGSLALSGGALQ